MTKKWLIADLHFDHNNIIELENRPFSNKEEMEVGLIAAWNNVVQKDHTVYILGDFSFKGVQSWERLLNQLNGEKILIQGNHDRPNVVEMMIDKGLLRENHSVGKYEKIDDKRIYFSHYPLGIGDRRNMYNIHGHIHSEMSPYNNQINVGIDSAFMMTYYREKSVPFGTPVSWDYVLDRMEQIKTSIEMTLQFKEAFKPENIDAKNIRAKIDPTLYSEGHDDLMKRTIRTIMSRDSNTALFVSE